MQQCDCTEGMRCPMLEQRPYEGWCKNLPRYLDGGDVLMPTITAQDKTADFISDKDKDILEAKRKIVFQQGRDLNLRDVVEVNLDGQWWRVKTADGTLHLVNASVVNYATIA